MEKQTTKANSKTTQIMELSDKYFKATIITMFKNIKKNTFIINK